MRIISGQFRGRRLAAIGKGDQAGHLRPTTDRVRESLFSVLTHLDGITDARVLDLFAGTGALGLESLSRGAAHVTFVDDGRVANDLIRENIALTRSQANVNVKKRDVMHLGDNPSVPYDLVFLDPPYGKNLTPRAITVLQAGDWLAPGALLVCEENSPLSAPTGFDVEDRRKYGETHVTLLRSSG